MNRALDYRGHAYGMSTSESDTCNEFLSQKI